MARRRLTRFERDLRDLHGEHLEFVQVQPSSRVFAAKRRLKPWREMTLSERASRCLALTYCCVVGAIGGVIIALMVTLMYIVVSS